MGRSAVFNPLGGSCVSPRRFMLGGGDLISNEAVLRGKPLTHGILTRDLKAAARQADLPRGSPCSASAGAHRPGCSWALRGRTAAGTCSRPGRRVLRPREGQAPRAADMLPALEEVCGAGGMRGQNGLCTLRLGEQAQAPRVPGEAAEPEERHGILGPALGLAGQPTHLGNDSGRGGGSIPG